MKRFLVLLLVAVMAVPVLFAVDVKASVNTKVLVWESEGGFLVSNENQNDDDLLSFTLAGEKAGAYFRLHSASNSDAAVTMRKLELWLKPIDMLKIKIGNVGGGLFTETIDWWQTANGVGGWENDIVAAAEGGVSVDLTPIDALSITVSLAPGYNAGLWDSSDSENQDFNAANVKWGVVAKYAIDGVGTIGAGFKFNEAYSGNNNEYRLVRAGFDFTAVEGLRAFIQGNIRFNNAGLIGIAIDPFVDFTAGSLNIKASVPVTLYQDDPAKKVGLQYDVHVSYAMDAVSPYFSIEQNDNMVFGGTTDAMFTPTINVGMTWGYDVGSFDLSFQLDLAMPDEPTTKTTWSIPFKARVTM